MHRTTSMKSPTSGEVFSKTSWADSPIPGSELDTVSSSKAHDLSTLAWPTHHDALMNQTPGTKRNDGVSNLEQLFTTNLHLQNFSVGHILALDASPGGASPHSFAKFFCRCVVWEKGNILSTTEHRTDPPSSSTLS